MAVNTIFNHIDAVERACYNNLISLSTKDLHCSIINGMIIDMGSLLSHTDADINSCVENHTPLTLAIQSGKVAFVKELLKYQILDVNKCNANGDTPLHLITCTKPLTEKDIEIAILLLSHPNTKYNIRNSNYITPLDMLLNALVEEKNEYYNTLLKLLTICSSIEKPLWQSLQIYYRNSLEMLSAISVLKNRIEFNKQPFIPGIVKDLITDTASSLFCSYSTIANI